MIYKKTLVLSSLDGGLEKAVVNIEKINGRFEGQLRLYNFKQEPSGILTLGILNGKNVLKAGLNHLDSKLYNFVLEDDKEFENSKSLTFALVNFKEGKPKPLLYGSTNGKLPTSTEIRLASTLSLFDENLSLDATTKKLNEFEIDYDAEEKIEIERVIDEHLKDEQNCAQCKYRKAFYATEEENKEKDEKKKPIFYDEVKNQINELFTSYPEEDFLKQIIPNSKWVKVDYENNGQYYVVGLIYDEGILKYICYGMPGMWEEKPPLEAEHATQWLPLDPNKPEGFGYWLSYQDATSGENITVEVI